MNMLMVQEFPIIQFAGLGIGGILAGVTLVFLCQDHKQSQRLLVDQAAGFSKAQQASEERYARLAQDFREIVEHNTQALTMLTTLLGQRRLEDDR
jgi:hypothetical protein